MRIPETVPTYRSRRQKHEGIAACASRKGRRNSNRSDKTGYRLEVATTSLTSPKPRVALIGGTSHVGKSTFAESLARKLLWQHMSTDRLSRHPGRPWRTEGRAPTEVETYFRTHSTEVLVDDVLQHYGRHVWPIASAIVRTRLSNPYDDCLVLEGSAIWPQFVADARFHRTMSAWFTAPDGLITERVHMSCRYDEQPPPIRAAVDGFLSRSLAFNERMLRAATPLRVRVVDVGDPEAIDGLLADWCSVLTG
jgi:2-phosphoglycerate kinase